MKVELLSITPNAEELIERAGRICYNSEMNPDTRKQFIKRLIAKGHESPIEHGVASFQIEGVSLNMTQQFFRHRLLSPSMRSLRYTKASPLDVVIPPEVLKNPEAFREYEKTIKVTEECYTKLLILGIKPEDARFVLPTATCTKYVVTANFREWRHIIKLRTDLHSQWELRNMMNEIKSILIEACPSVFEDLE